VEIDAIVATFFSCGEPFQQRLPLDRRAQPFVGVCVHDPVMIGRRKHALLAAQLVRQGEFHRPRQLFDIDETSPPELARNLSSTVCRFIVDQVDFQPGADESSMQRRTWIASLRTQTTAKALIIGPLAT
jgi:hypothetical protein